MTKNAAFPSVRTTGDFKEKVYVACKSIKLSYSDVVENLLMQWISGNITLNTELDADFIESSKLAIESEQGQASLQKLAENFNPDRTYQNTVKI